MDVDAIKMAESAVRVLDEPAHLQAMSAMETAILRQVEECPIRDTEGMQLLLQLLKLHRKYESWIKGAIETGKLERFKLEQLRKDSKMSQFKNRFG